ncbi:hypothetical protein D920_02662 [Enterococcus faecalis 13-SD-W-01]|nr:hypothetical protein D920_02662 [Enterococcus faecalis 13-SD-W-01]
MLDKNVYLTIIAYKVNADNLVFTLVFAIYKKIFFLNNYFFGSVFQVKK